MSLHCVYLWQLYVLSHTVRRAPFETMPPTLAFAEYVPPETAFEDQPDIMFQIVPGSTDSDKNNEVRDEVCDHVAAVVAEAVSTDSEPSGVGRGIGSGP